MHKVLSSPSSARIHQEEIGDVFLYFQDSFRQIFYPKCYPACSLSLATSLTCATFSLKEEAVQAFVWLSFNYYTGPSTYFSAVLFNYLFASFLYIHTPPLQKFPVHVLRSQGKFQTLLMVALHVA